MSLRKIAALLAAFGLMVGLIGTGVGAVFTDQVTALQKVNVGTFGCSISSTNAGVSLGDYVNGYAHSVSYSTDALSSTGSAPFDFTVTSTGTIPVQVTVTLPGLPSGWFDLLSDPGPQNLTAAGNAGDSYTYHAGLAWANLTNGDLGTSVSATWTVNCGEVVSTAIFDNHPAKLPSNLASVGPEAYSFAQFGGGATFDGTARKLATATVTMSSWACQTGSWDAGDCATTPGATYNVPITFKIYNVGAGNTVGSLITSRTQTFAIRYRPSADPADCPADPNYYAPHAVKWYDGTTCYNGIADNITFTFPAGTTLPNDVIFGISYNTTHYGPTPLGGSGSPTDSLNIAMYPGTGNGTVATTPSVGAFLPDGLSAYLNDTYGAQYLDNGAGGTGTFRLDTGPKLASDPIGPYGGYEPAVQITATN